MSRDTVLQVEDLSVSFPLSSGQQRSVVQGVSFSIERGQMLGIVGESGSGKTMIALSILGLVPGSGSPSSGRILLNGMNLLQRSDKELREVRGRDVSIVFQDPLASLNPVRRVGSLLTRTVMLHQACGEAVARRRAVEMLGAVGIPNPESCMYSYPHEFSGGQRQRIMVALAAINNPSLIIADEPTTSLDATVQVQILDLLKSLASGCSSLLITHDLSVTAGVCEYVMVMQDGRIIESGAADDVLSNPQEQYTKALVDAVPRFSARRLTQPGKSVNPPPRPLLEVRHLEVTYSQSGRPFKAVEDVSFRVNRGDTLGIVGESGSGKSTIAKALMQMVRPAAGQLVFDGRDLRKANRQDTRAARRRIQYVFQDPYGSLDPRWSVGRIIAEPMHVHGVGTKEEIRRRVAKLIRQVELPAETIDRYPSEFSGGQRQRIALARSLGVAPDLLIADEPVSSLDVTIQLKIAHLLKSLQQEFSLSLILIAHDLPLVYQMTDRVVVVYLGQVVEQGPTEVVLRRPKHPYTASLLAACNPESFASVAESLRTAGEPASLQKPPNGCRFHPRCPVAGKGCSTVVPKVECFEDGTEVRCHYPGEVCPEPGLHSGGSQA